MYIKTKTCTVEKATGRGSQETWNVAKALFFLSCGNHATSLCLFVSLAIKWCVEATSSTVILYPDITT